MGWFSKKRKLSKLNINDGFESDIGMPSKRFSIDEPEIKPFSPSSSLLVSPKEKSHELVLAKLDLINHRLDSIERRIAEIERIAKSE